ncbi:MAG: carbamoyl phosphate synthase large subunit, partial [Desulfobacterales bacterium CG23_combo_of_CG06-09_8_20_14_all_51_8]
MPKRTDIHKILIIGAGPIIISQACEFDYSGTQACKALREEGYEVVLVNSNPATIMTDPDMADATYIEPVTPKTVEMIIEKERPDALLPTLGGQTGLNTAVAVAENGVLAKYGVEMIGADLASINMAEDRDLFRQAMHRIGLRIPKSGIARNMDHVRKIAEDIGFPLIVRPSFTLGGTGGGVAYNPEDLEVLAASGLDASMNTQIMLEESVLGWKEYELEVMRDKNDNVVIVCSIENM